MVHSNLKFRAFGRASPPYPLPAMNDQKTPSPDVEASAQAELRKAIEELRSIRLRLEEVHASLPDPAREGHLMMDEMEWDMAAELRTVVECVLNDSLAPAIRDLEAVARPRPIQ